MIEKREFKNVYRHVTEPDIVHLRLRGELLLYLVFDVVQTD